MARFLALCIAAVALIGFGASPAAAAPGEFGAREINTPGTQIVPAFPGTRAFWAGACNLHSPLTEVNVVPPPSSPRDCIDLGTYATNVWTQPPSWRLAAVARAGAHPEGTAAFTFEGTDGDTPAGNTKDVSVDLPVGVVGNPVSVPMCSQADFAKSPVQCPPESQVGISFIRLLEGGGLARRVSDLGFPIYSLEPRPGYIAEFGVPDVGVDGSAIGTSVRIWARARTESDYGISSGAFQIPSAYPLHGQTVTFWGIPWAASHDLWRISRGAAAGNPSCAAPSKEALSFGMSSKGLPPECQVSYNPSWGPVKPFFSLQTSCTGDTTTTLKIDSYQNPGRWLNPEERLAFRIPDPADPNWRTYLAASPAMHSCEEVPWTPSLDLEPVDHRADSPMAMDVELRTPQNNDAKNEAGLPLNPPAEDASESEVSDYLEDAFAYFKSPEGVATSHLKDTVVTLAEGITFNAGAAHGLDGCSPEEIGLTSPIGARPATFNNKDVTCPESSLIGTLQVNTPLLEKPLPGFIYLADQDQNAFGDTFGIYLMVQEKERNVIIKVAGSVVPDPNTGQITAAFLNNPQLPFEILTLQFRGGPNAPLASPTTCGTHSSESYLTAWSAPNSPVHVSSPFEINSAPAGGCPTSSAARPFGLGLNAGSSNAQAGARSPFQVQVTRPDGNQEIDKLEISPPPGFVASLRGIPYCPEAAIAAASSRDGKAEQATPTCPASEVGNTQVGAGAGSAPYYARGKLYLAGPYKGENLSVVSITPAVAGPYDLGTVVIRSALKIDPLTARITAVTDPLPQVFEGIPLRVRDIRIDLDRPGWAMTPTNCEAMSVDITAYGTGGAISKLSNPYQVRGCEKLGFKPKLSIRFKGGTKRGDHPALVARLSTRDGDANIARAAVTLPRASFLDQSHIRTICTRVQFAADACPKGATYGFAEASTELLDEPLKGNVILRSSNNKLPDLVGHLKGVAEIEAVGRIDSINGGIRNTFDIVPDAPFDAFTLRMQGGKKGLVVNSQNLCAKTHRATVKLTAHNGRRYNFRPKVVATGCKKANRKKNKGHKRTKAAR